MIFTPNVGLHCDPHAGNIAIRPIENANEGSGIWRLLQKRLHLGQLQEILKLFYTTMAFIEMFQHL